MAETEVKQWRYRCITEGKDITEWRPDRPVNCHKDPNHQIDENSICSKGAVTSEVMQVEVVEEKVPTKKHFRIYTGTMTAEPGDVASKVIMFGFDINIMSGGARVQNDGDEIALNMAPGVPMGTITEAASIGDAKLNVQQSVISFPFISVGGILTIEDGDSKENFYVNDIDDGHDQLLVSALKNNYAQGSTIKFTRRLLHSDLEDYAVMPGNACMKFGEANIKATNIPANTPIVPMYKNNGQETGTCFFEFEYFFGKIMD